VDLILTDPQYGKKFLPVWSDLATFAVRALKPGGFLVAYSGQTHLPEVLQALTTQLQYVWMVAQLGRGSRTAVHAVRVHSAWKPVLVFCKPPRAATSWFPDVLDGRGPEKTLHRWQQAEYEAERLVENFSPPDSLVVDPYFGSGTVAVAAARLGRDFVGSDIDPHALRLASKRLQERADRQSAPAG
jgi:methylase of polypeptide subunit release factors